uniref:Endothelin-like toxin domain-containing protein n=1 Tax=Gouania willdenowi TaxID=441366 RepID=A0A8C5DS86_GOUWI
MQKTPEETHKLTEQLVSFPTAEERPPVQLHHRERRCSCENQKDKECIFYCHTSASCGSTPEVSNSLLPQTFVFCVIRRRNVFNSVGSR